MKTVGLVLVLVLMVSPVFAEKKITITLTDDEYKAMLILTSTPEEWANNAVKGKAQKMLNELIDKNSDKKLEKMTEEEKKEVMNSVDIEKEKELRK